MLPHFQLVISKNATKISHAESNLTTIWQFRCILKEKLGLIGLSSAVRNTEIFAKLPLQQTKLEDISIWVSTTVSVAGYLFIISVYLSEF